MKGKKPTKANKKIKKMKIIKMKTKEKAKLKKQEN